MHGDFSNGFKAMFPLLSPQEIKLRRLFKDESFHEGNRAAAYISVRGVEIVVSLKKKVAVRPGSELQDFILTFSVLMVVSLNTVLNLYRTNCI